MPQFDSGELAEWSAGEWQPGAPALVDGVSNDTRSIRAGELYVALRGPNHDGHAYVGEAFGKGAAAVLVERGAVSSVRAQSPGGMDWPLLCVADTRAALAAMASGYRAKVSPRVVGVTGSAGKSTVKEMIAQVLSRVSRTASTRGNWNNDIGVPLSLLAMAPDTEVGVFEAGTNHPGEIRVLCDLLGPSWGVVTNVGPAHIEFFGSLEAVAREKASLLECLPGDGTAVLDRDGAFFDLLRDAVTGAVVTTSLGGAAEYRVTRRDVEAGTFEVLERKTDETVELRLGLPGEHSVRNALLAVAVARGLGAPWADICAGIEGFRQLPMRWEVCVVGGVTIVNDAYNANPVSMRAAIEAFDSGVKADRKWLVLGDMLELGELGPAEHVALGEFVSGREWEGLIALGALAAEIAAGARRAGMRKERVFCCDDTVAAAQIVSDRLEAGDAALLKASRGAGLERVLEQLRNGEVR